MGGNAFKSFKPSYLPINMQVVTINLVRAMNLKDGLWRLCFKFDSSGMNVNWQGTLKPAALVTMQEIGLIRAEKPDEMTVDARDCWTAEELAGTSAAYGQAAQKLNELPAPHSAPNLVDEPDRPQ